MGTEFWTVTGPQVIEVDEVRSLRVQVVGGHVDVVTHDGPGVRLEVHSVDGRPVEVSLDDGELRVGYPFTLSPWERFLDLVTTAPDRDRADISLAVPVDLPTKVGTVSAEGLLAGVHAVCSVATVSGSLVVDGTRGTLGAHTVSGEIVVRDHAGGLTLNSVSGELAASGALDAVHANSVSGELALDVTTAPVSIDATSVSGDITVRLPEGEGVHLTAHALSGRLVMDGESHGGGLPGRSVDVTSGDGRSRVSASTVSGNVTVVRGARVGAV